MTPPALLRPLAAGGAPGGATPTPDLPAAGRAPGPVRGLGLAGACIAAVALGAGLSAALERPAWVAGAFGVALLLFAVREVLRRHGAAAVWIFMIVGSILAGEMSALSLGGQSGRLLWCDLVIGVGVAVLVLHSGLRVDLPRAPLLAVVAALVAWSGLTLLFARDPLTAIAEIKEWIAAFVVGAVALTQARDARQARVLLGVVALTCAGVGLWMCAAAWASPLGFVLAVLSKQVDLPWGRTNYLAGLLLIGIPLSLGLLGSARDQGSRLLWLGVTASQGAGLALSASKGAMLALLVGFCAAAAGGRRAPRSVLVAGLLLIALGAAAFAFTPLQQVLAYRAQSSAIEYSMGERTDLYALAIDEALRHPLTGIGLNNFSVAANRLRGVDTVPHNLTLGLAAELGAVGIVLSFALMWVLLATGWRARAALARTASPALGVGVWIAMVAVVVHNQFESTLYGQQFKILLVVTAAAGWGIALGSRPEARSPRASDGPADAQTG